MKLFSMLAAGALALAAAIPAARSTATAAEVNVLTITSFQCWDMGGGGVYYNNTECEATTSGGAGTVSFDWDVIVNYRYDTSNYSHIWGVCTDSYPVTLTVTDANGATATAFEEFACSARGYGSGGGIDP
jgi:hypothetical protein